MARKFALRKLIELRISRGLSQRGLSQRGLAELIDTSGVTVSRWERGATDGTASRKLYRLPKSGDLAKRPRLKDLRRRVQIHTRTQKNAT